MVGRAPGAVVATSLRTCEAALDAIAAGRWLADDPPAGMRCERGSAFAPGWDCIAGIQLPMTVRLIIGAADALNKARPV